MTLKKIYTFFFFLGIFFIPFNEFDGLPFLGEYKDEAATYFFLIGFFFLLIESLFRGKMSIPIRNSLGLLLVAFLLWTIISTALNFETVKDNYFKATSGISRFIRQSISLYISAVIFSLLFWNVIKNYSSYDIFLKIRKVILFSFIFVALYGFIEIAIVFFGMGFLLPILKGFDIIPFVNTFIQPNRKGISSITFEVPALATYLISTLPWMVSYIYTEKKLYKFIPLGTILILVFFSDSRSALIVILAQLMLLGLLFLLDPRFKQGTLKVIKIAAIISFGALLWKSDDLIETYKEKADRVNFAKNWKGDISNKSRFGIQYATFRVFEDHPIIGVGLGQNAYHSLRYYPYWATKDNWEFRLRYKNQAEKSFPPGYNYYTRTLAELGVIGFSLFGSLILLSVYYSGLFWKFTTDHLRFMGVILILSFVGIAINWMQLDYFRQYGFWLSLMLLIKLRQDYQNNAIE